MGRVWAKKRKTGLKVSYYILIPESEARKIIKKYGPIEGKWLKVNLYD